jgi:hypothetical protein
VNSLTATHLAKHGMYVGSADEEQQLHLSAISVLSDGNTEGR